MVGLRVGQGGTSPGPIETAKNGKDSQKWQNSQKWQTQAYCGRNMFGLSSRLLLCVITLTTHGVTPKTKAHYEQHGGESCTQPLAALLQRAHNTWRHTEVKITL